MAVSRGNLRSGHSYLHLANDRLSPTFYHPHSWCATAPCTGYPNLNDDQPRASCPPHKRLRGLSRRRGGSSLYLASGITRPSLFHGDMTTTTTMTTKVLMLLAVFVCVALAQRPGSQRCLCRRISSRLRTQASEVEDIQIHPPGNSCDRMEFVVSLKNGLQYCLDPKIKLVQKMLRSFMNKPGPTSPPQLPEQR